MCKLDFVLANANNDEIVRVVERWIHGKVDM